MNEGNPATPQWNKARNRAQARTAMARRPNIFAGSAKGEHAFVEQIPVRRLSVSPDEQGSVPGSFAVIADIAWQVKPDFSLADTIHWRQTTATRWDFSFPLKKSTRCLGLGERYSGLNLRGARHTLCTTDATKHTEFADSLYKAIPFVILQDGPDCTGIFLDSPGPQRWDLDSELTGEGTAELYSGRGWQLYVLGPAMLPDVVRAYTKLTGRTSLPPLWSLGYQQCRWSYPDEETVRNIAAEFRRRHIPCDTIVLDIDYMDEYRVFTHSKERFPHFKQLIADLAKSKFKVVTIVDPGVKHEAGYSLYDEGKDGNLFCKTLDGEIYTDQVWPGLSVFPDFLKPQTRKWWGRHHEFYIKNGVAGIWNDMNEPAFFNKEEPLPADADDLPPLLEHGFVQAAPDGEVGHLEVRNLYGILMSRATHEALTEQQKNKRPFILTRSGYAGIQRYAAVWLGDNNSWWEHLRKSIPMLLNIGLSGVPFAGVDVGGFTGDCSPELLVRWHELGIFYPFFRNHCRMEGRAQEPWAYGAKVESLIRSIIETRYRLLPYIQRLFWEHHRTGAPLMRPLSWHYPQDSYAYELDDEFLFGKDILVAPILDRARTHRSTYFPEGQWHPFSGGPALEGNQTHELHHELGSIPAFIREGAIIPLADAVESTEDLATAPMTFAAYGEQASGIFIEDDGISSGWQRGEFNEWHLSFDNGAFAARPIHRQYQAPPRTLRLFVNNSGLYRSVSL